MTVDSSASPQVSVVMSVYNDARNLLKTLESILAQQGVLWECIVVNDGSQDLSGEILDAIAKKDTRFRIFHKENQGLTQALIFGCQQARGKFIARHDSGDVSLPNRLAEQAEYLERNDSVALVSAYTRFAAHRGEYLYASMPSIHRTEIQRAKASLRDFQMPSHHGCTMFRKELYFQAGGYRAAFYFAQDLDLWSRVIEWGAHVVLPQFLYQAQFEKGSISGCYAQEQQQLKQLIVKATAARRSQQDESPFLNAAKQIKREERAITNKRRRLARESYFVGSCLLASQAPTARSYLLECLSHNPFHLKGWAKLIQSHLV